MKTHIESTHPCLVAKRKLQLSNNSMAKLYNQSSHNQQRGKKRVWANEFCNHCVFWFNKPSQEW
jgi:hypothetical protein